MHDVLIKATDPTGSSAISTVGIDIRTPGTTVIAGTDDSDLVGTDGSDTFVFHPNCGNITVTGFEAQGSSHDVLQLDHNIFSDWAHLLGATRQVGSDLQITLDPQDSILVKDVALATFTKADARFV